MKKKQIIILIVLVILVLIYVIAKIKQPIEKEIRFFHADSANIAKMEFISANDTIKIVKQKDQWKLTYPLFWDVNPEQIKQFFTRVLPIKTSSTSMSDEPSHQSLYKVDDANAVQIKLYSSTGGILDHVYIGNGGTSTFDYGRHKGSNSIYQIKDNIYYIVNPDIYQWRSPNITNIKLDNIEKIEVEYTKNKYTLTIEKDSIRFTDKYNNFMIPEHNRAQWKIINALENLSTYQFEDNPTPQMLTKFNKPDCTIKVYLKNNTTKTFTLVREEKSIEPISPSSPAKNITILMMIDNQEKPLYKMTGDFINRFTRAPQHFRVEFD